MLRQTVLQIQLAAALQAYAVNPLVMSGDKMLQGSCKLDAQVLLYMTPS